MTGNLLFFDLSKYGPHPQAVRATSQIPSDSARFALTPVAADGRLCGHRRKQKLGGGGGSDAYRLTNFVKRSTPPTIKPLSYNRSAHSLRSFLLEIINTWLSKCVRPVFFLSLNPVTAFY